MELSYPIVILVDNEFEILKYDNGEIVYLTFDDSIEKSENMHMIEYFNNLEIEGVFFNYNPLIDDYKDYCFNAFDYDSVYEQL